MNVNVDVTAIANPTANANADAEANANANTNTSIIGIMLRRNRIILSRIMKMPAIHTNIKRKLDLEEKRGEKRGDSEARREIHLSKKGQPLSAASSFFVSVVAPKVDEQLLWDSANIGLGNSGRLHFGPPGGALQARGGGAWPVRRCGFGIFARASLHQTHAGTTRFFSGSSGCCSR